MKEKVSVWVVFVLLLVFAGCTPFSEGIVKKAKTPSTSNTWTGVNPVQADEIRPPAGLDLKTRSILLSYRATIRTYADRYGFDWRLVLAVMKAESRFHMDAESHKGASGLMQIMPVTGEEVARVLSIEDITDPVNNIHAGVYYLHRLYRLFEGANEEDRIRLTLAAYNAGMARIYDAQEVAAYMNENPYRWKSVRDALPLLSKRYYTLHRNVWEQDRPRGGWFGNSKETLAYVEKIMNYYDEYRFLLN